MFDREENPKTGLRPWQQIQKLGTYITDVQSISYATLGVCHMWEKVFEERRSLCMTPWDRRDSYGGRQFLGGGGVPTLEDTMVRVWTLSNQVEDKTLRKKFWVVFSSLTPIFHAVVWFGKRHDCYERNCFPDNGCRGNRKKHF